MADSLQEQVLRHVQCSHAALDAANTALEKTAAEKKAAAAIIPEVVEALVRFDRIDPAQREKAAAALADHATTLQILLKTADVNNTVTQKIGTPAGPGTKEASTKLRYVGQRTSEKTAADAAYEKHLTGR